MSGLRRLQPSARPNWRKIRHEMVPLVESGYREVFNVVQ
jgi:hypothetical protein